MSDNKTSLAYDVTRALNLALRPSRIVVLSLGLLIGVAAAILFFWVGGLIDEEAIRWLGWTIQRIGAIIFAYVVLASMSSAVAMAHAESTGERIGVLTGWAQIARYVRPIAVGTVKPIIVFVGLAVLIWLAGVLGWIPQVGPILWSIISIIPVAAGLVAILVLVKLFLVSFVFPAVLSVTKENGIACYKESVRFIKGHAAHVLGRLAVALLICLAFYKILLAGFSFTASHSSRTMGKNRVTLYGSALFEYVAGIPGVSGTAPVGFAVENPASPFRGAAWKTPVLDVRALLERRQVAAVTPSMKATQKVGGWIFSLILIVVSVVLLSLPFLFFALSGYCTFVSFKDAPEIPLRTEEVDWSAIKETAQEITGKRKGERPEKRAK